MRGSATIQQGTSQTAYLERNLAALAARGVVPFVAGDLGSAFRIEDGAGGPVLLWRRDTNWIALNSRRDPLREAHAWLDQSAVRTDSPIVFVAGAGLGYVLEAIGQRSPNARVVVFEPHADCARALLSRRDWTSWIEQGRLDLWTGPAYEGAVETARLLDGHAEPPLIEHPVMVREMREVMLGTRRAIARILFGARANAEAQRRFGSRYLLNTLRNLGVIASESDTDRLAGRFAGMPAVIASAGPSLDDSLPTLAAHAGRTLIIAADTAARPLLNAGIRPHLVAALDPARINAEHLLDLPDVSDVWLAAEGSVHPAALRAFAGRLFTFQVGDHQPWPWLTHIGCGRGRLDVWGSVATAAFDLARRMGCNPIVFTGQDLAYTDGRPYCFGTTFDESGYRYAPRTTDIPAVDIRGCSTTTAPHLVAFRDWLVAQSIRHPAVRMINASNGGILHGGRIEIESLESALAAVAHADDGDLRRALRAAHRVEPSVARTVIAHAASVRSADGEPMSAWRAFAGADTAPSDVLEALRDGTGAASARLSAGCAVASPQPRRPFMEAYVGITTRAVGHQLRRLAARDRHRLCLAADAAPHLVLLSDATGFTVLARDRERDRWAPRPEPPPASELFPAVIVTVDDGQTEESLSPALHKAGRRLAPGGQLAIVDLTRRVVGAAVRRSVVSLLATQFDISVVAVRHSDPLTRVTVLARRAAGADPRAGHTQPPSVADTTAFALLIAQRSPTGTVAVLGQHAEAWAAALRREGRSCAALTRLGEHGAQDRYDVAVAMAAAATANDVSAVADALVALSDTVVFSVGQPGCPSSTRTPSTLEWTHSFLARGYAVSDELRAGLEDRDDFPTRSFDLDLYVARRLPADARLVLASSPAIRELFAAQIARCDDLFKQATALTLERQAAGNALDEDAAAWSSALALALAPSDIEHSLGHRFTFRFGDARLRLGLRAGLFRHAVLEEDGSPLPRPHAIVGDIAEQGNGRYTVWTDAIHLSSSDNTDPRTNGRHYQLRVPSRLAALVNREGVTGVRPDGRTADRSSPTD
jgi:hypothetical protein